MKSLMVRSMNPKEIPNSTTLVRIVGRCAPIVFFVIIGLALAGCGGVATVNYPAAVSSSTPVSSTSASQPPVTSNQPPTIPTSSSTPQPPPIPLPSSTPQPALADPSGYNWVRVVSGLDAPVNIQNAGDGSGRIFIVEKHGRIRILQSGQLLPTPFLDIQNEVGSQHTEQGLLGLAFHPNYGASGLFYINYIDVNGNTVIARFHVSVNDPNQADPASEDDILRVKQPYNNHNGGGQAFGPDGYLYLGLGDGGSEGDPLRNGQNLQTLLGKLLRIDIDHGSKYDIPPNNPFAQTGGLPEIWAYGLRNPWRFSFDKTNGNLFIADVGQDAWEEVDFVPSGTASGINFGWSFYEGLHPYQDQPPANVNFTKPVFEYSHAEGCSVSGGYVYRGQAMPEWQGVYFFGDYCSGNVWGLVHPGEISQQVKILFTTGAQITTFGVDEAGDIYLADYKTGSLLRLEHKQ